MFVGWAWGPACQAAASDPAGSVLTGRLSDLELRAAIRPIVEATADQIVLPLSGAAAAQAPCDEALEGGVEPGSATQTGCLAPGADLGRVRPKGAMLMAEAQPRRFSGDRYMPPPPSPSAPSSTGAADAWGVVYTQGDYSLGGAVTAALTGDMDSTGLRLQAGASFDRYSYRSDGLPSKALGTTKEILLLAGVELAGRDYRFSIYAGPSYVHDEAKVGSIKLSESSTFDIRTSASLLWTPNDRISLFVQGGYTRADHGYSASGAMRYALRGGLGVGPEFHLTGNRHYWQVRVGPYVSGVSAGPVSLQFSAGAVMRDKGPSRGYLSIGAYTAF